MRNESQTSQPSTNEAISMQPPAGVWDANPLTDDLQQPPKAQQRGARVIQLDFARGIAILAVMAFHFHSVPVHNVLARSFDFVAKHIGWMGVDLFFVLSGFLVGGLLVQELIKTGDVRIKRFLFRRMMKIWPAYYAYILFQIIARKHPLNSFAWQNLLNIQNYAGTSLNHTWSLAVEEHFYLFLPLFLVFLYKKTRLRENLTAILAVCCSFVLIGRILSVFVWHRGDPQFFTHARIDALLFGVLLSWNFYTRRAVFEKWLNRKALLTVILILGLIAGLHDGHKTPFMWSFGYTLTYLSLGSLLLLIYSYEGRGTRTLLYRVIAAIGVYSYGIYLWHLSVRDPLASICAHLPLSVRWGSLLISQYAAAIVLGILTTKAVEFPMLRLRDRIMPRGPANLPPAHP